MERCLVFPCILHCCIAMPRLQVAFIEARLGDLPEDNATAVPRLLYRAHMGVKLGASPSPDAEDARACSSHGRKSSHYWPMPRKMVSGKRWLPCGTSSGTCT